jgi:hypothetical protein
MKLARIDSLKRNQTDQPRRRPVKTVVVRYKTQPERAEENQKLVENVYAALEELGPDGFSYATFRLEDGVTFVHIAREGDASGFNLSELPAFRAFVENVADRCVEPPDAEGATVVGSYKFLAS